MECPVRHHVKAVSVSGLLRSNQYCVSTKVSARVPTLSCILISVVNLPSDFDSHSGLTVVSFMVFSLTLRFPEKHILSQGFSAVAYLHRTIH